MNNINNNYFKTKLLFGNLSNSERELYDEISKQVDIPDVMRILDLSHFFVKKYLQQEFKQSSRFKIDKIHPSGIPLKESHEKRLKKNKKTSVKFSSHNKNEEQELQLSNFEGQKQKLRYFTMGSKQHPKQFERWSPEEMYNWWYKLRTSGIPKSEWKILDAVFFLFINQISCICNSYIRYGIKNNSNTKNVFKEELRLLSEYFTLLDEFYKSGGEYGLLIDTHLAFCEWIQNRIINDNDFKMYIEYENNRNNIINLFNEKKKNKLIELDSSIKNVNNTMFKDKLIKYIKFIINKNNNYSLVLFTSYFQKPADFDSLFSIPVITIIGIPHKSHNGLFYLPMSQIFHEFIAHGTCLMKYHLYIYSQSSLNDIKLFKQKMIFLQLLWKRKNNDSQLLLWYILHESYIFKKLVINSKSKDDIRKILTNYYKNNEYIEDLLNKNINLQNPYFCQNFFEIDILLEQLKRFKFVVENIISSERGKLVLPKLLACINILIETCQETLERDKPIVIIKEPKYILPYNKKTNNNNNNNNP